MSSGTEKKAQLFALGGVENEMNFFLTREGEIWFRGFLKSIAASFECKFTSRSISLGGVVVSK
jgi:hypothetical protein